MTDLLNGVLLDPDLKERLERPLNGRARGGFQNLIRRLRGRIDGDEIRVNAEELETMERYTARYGEGGFQGRLKSLAVQIRLANPTA